jgi:hypothetical protein
MVLTRRPFENWTQISSFFNGSRFWMSGFWMSRIRMFTVFKSQLHFFDNKERALETFFKFLENLPEATSFVCLNVVDSG